MKSSFNQKISLTAQFHNEYVDLKKYKKALWLRYGDDEKTLIREQPKLAARRTLTADLGNLVTFLPTTILYPASSLPPQLGGSIAPRLTTMDSKEASGTVRKPGPKPLQSSSLRTQYLILYNFVSMILWLVVLGRVVLLVPLVGFGRVYQGAGNFTKWTQTMALLEVVHSAVGIILPSKYLHWNSQLTHAGCRYCTSPNWHNLDAGL